MTIHFLFSHLLECCKLVVSAALQGQTLAILTIVFFAHAIVHVQSFGWAIFTVSDNSSSSSSCIRIASTVFLVITFVLTSLGYLLLIALYRHSVQNVFNKNLPTTFHNCIPSFAVHFALLKPIEILFRYATANWRVLPDVIVLGEVRCGTTTFCQYLTDFLPGCHAPFCLWKHPELDNKETFFFVGHYLGFVSPSYYSMCFPLKITKWFYQKVLKTPFFTFDGCSQYLTSPTAPYLLANAYLVAGQPPPILIVCLRNPIDQAISWWKYENNAMIWANSMNLTEWNTDLRSLAYPPSTLHDAIEFSLSEETEKLYVSAEQLFLRINNCQINNSKSHYYLPPWAMTWPRGQLSTFGRSGRYAKNIRRYERVFSEAFGKGDIPMSCKLPSSASNLRHVNVLPFEYLTNISLVDFVLKSVHAQLSHRCPMSSSHKTKGITPQPTYIHRNRSSILLPATLKPTLEDEHRLAKLFALDSSDLEILCGIRLDKNTE